MRKLILIALACYATTAVAQIYTWKDSSGITHYSDKPPAGKATSVKELPVPPAPAPTQAKGADSRVKQPDIGTREKAGKEEVAAQSKQADCAKAKSDLQAFENRPRRTAVGAGGKFHALDGEERAAEEVVLRKAIEDACK